MAFTHITQLVQFIKNHDGINDKIQLSNLVAEKFSLIKDRSVYYNDSFAIRFCETKTTTFSNTVLSLSSLQKFDSRPFFVCIVTQGFNYLLISNSTFLKKISHSSQQLSIKNIKGSFNGSDILRTFESIDNIPDYFERLYLIHDAIGFQGNLPRLVDATKAIVGTGHEYSISANALATIKEAPKRAKLFTSSKDYVILKNELEEKVKKNEQAILAASLIDNVNIRGRVIEYIVAGEEERLREELIRALLENQDGLPRFSTDNSLGDYTREFESYYTETDVKTKVMALDSNPKAYNIDKMLEFLSRDKSVFLFYFIGIDPGKVINTVLVSMFEDKLIKGTLLLKHWAGRNSRGVTQLEGKVIKEVLINPSDNINIDDSKAFIEKMINS